MQNKNSDKKRFNHSISIHNKHEESELVNQVIVESLSNDVNTRF